MSLSRHQTQHFHLSNSTLFHSRTLRTAQRFRQCDSPTAPSQARRQVGLPWSLGSQPIRVPLIWMRDRHEREGALPQPLGSTATAAASVNAIREMQGGGQASSGHSMRLFGPGLSRHGSCRRGDRRLPLRLKGEGRGGERGVCICC